jgi:hypothetical protein
MYIIYICAYLCSEHLEYSLIPEEETHLETDT